MKQQKTDQGFTIIEVVLVLAIAGLIFLMVFIALPALQRNQRDTARKNEVSKVLSAITSYQSNNRGAAPDVGDLDSYLDADEGELDSGTTVVTKPFASTISGIGEDQVVFVMKAKCGSAGSYNDANKTVSYNLTSGTSRQAVALAQLENGNTAFCQES